MSWIFSKAMMEHCESLHSSLGLEAGYLVESCSDGGQYAQLSVMPTPHKFWRNDKTMEFSKLSQFGLTCKLLTEGLGKELLTLYLADFHAKTYRSQEKVRESKVRDLECGKSFYGLFAIYNQDSCLWKTAQCSLVEDLEWYSETWPRQGMTRNGRAYLRLKSERTTCEIESGYWATPTTMDKLPPKSSEALLKEATVARPGRSKPANLRDQVSNMQNWPTPRSCRAMQAPITEATSQRSVKNLEQQVAKYPTPTAHNAKEQNSPSESARNTPTLSSVVGGKLNPRFVEWLMNWPLKWTELNDESKLNTQESTKSDFNKWHELSSMQFNGKTTQASSRLQQAVGGRDNLREVPREAARYRALEQSQKRESLPCVHKYIYLRSAKKENMQQSMCAQIVMGESWWAKEPNIGRVANEIQFVNDQLKAIGNGQVPLAAATAFKELINRFIVK